VEVRSGDMQGLEGARAIRFLIFGYLSETFVIGTKISDYSGDNQYKKYRYIYIHIGYRYILPVPTFKYQKKKEIIACWLSPLLTNWQHTLLWSEYSHIFNNRRQNYIGTKEYFERQLIKLESRFN
jgi:hypothetical protein